MNLFEQELCRILGKENFDKVQSVKIGIAGAGGLGSNCAFNLTRMGFKKFCIVDFDKVEFSNLNRQFYFYDQIGRNKVEVLKENLERINPNVGITALTQRIERENIRELFNDCGVVAEAFDRAEYKSLLTEAFLETDKFIVSASGLSGVGNSDEIKVHQIKEKFFLIGDLKSDSNDAPPLSARVNIAAAKQADVILDYVLKRMD
ncbi:MAG: sulfur carrier protein ThiS adenylyltransferase ThiF [Candidatus Aceula meridiana]|nr:sulfur carrier protein ThiS adenylyltransferase ThiF [Candidatus Aceula meridiana]